MHLTPDCQHCSTLGFTQNSVTGASSLQDVYALVEVATARFNSNRAARVECLIRDCVSVNFAS